MGDIHLSGGWRKAGEAVWARSLRVAVSPVSRISGSFSVLYSVLCAPYLVLHIICQCKSGRSYNTLSHQCGMSEHKKKKVDFMKLFCGGVEKTDEHNATTTEKSGRLTKQFD